MKKIVFLVMILTVILAMTSCFSKHEHSPSNDLTVIKEATCVEEGVAHIYCKECGEIVDTITIEKNNNHTERIIPAVESTCQSTGLTEGKECSTCGETLLEQREAPLKAHAEEIIPSVESSCTATGLTEGKKCSVCHSVLVPQEESPIKSHEYYNNKDLTCNVCGYKRDCSHSETIVLEAKEATCTSVGFTEGKQCLICEEILVSQETVSVKPHSETITSAVAPDCITTGLSEGVHCSVCGEVIVEQTILNALGHLYNSENICNVCGDYEDKGVSFTLYNNEYYISSYKGSAAEIIIPSEYRGYPVTNINNYAFSNCESVTSIVIPDSVTRVGRGAFEKCNNLESLTLPFVGEYRDGSGETHFTYVFGMYDAGNYNTVLEYLPASLKTVNITGGTTIKSQAFYCCSTIERITLPNTITSISERAFVHCDNLKSINIPDGITKIEYATFEECGFTSIHIPDSVEIIDEFAFISCKFENITFGANSQLSYIGYKAFDYCKNLTSIELPAKITNIDRDAFNGCDSLENIYVHPDNETYQSIDGNLYSKDGKTIIKLAPGKMLADFVIPNGVTTIGDFAFNERTSLTSVSIPSTVTEIGWCAFYSCSNLTSIYYDGSINKWNKNITKQNFWDDGTGEYVVYCSNGKIAKDGTVIEGGGSGGDRFSEVEFTLNDSGYYSVTGLGSCEDTEIIIPSTYNGIPVIEISQYAFYDCDSVVSVTISNGIKRIGYSAFEECNNLRFISLPDTINYIGSYAFYACDNIEYNVFDDVNYLGNDDNPYAVLVKVVDENSNRYTYNINSETKYINEFAFEFCNSLSSIAIPNGVLGIGECAFYYCEQLSYVEIPDSVVEIGYGAFRGCENLQYKTYNNGRYLGNSNNPYIYLYDNTNTSSTAFEIHSNTKLIDEGIFVGAESLEVLTIPNTVLYIHSDLFDYCYNLHTINYGGSRAQWNAIARDGWDSLWTEDYWYTMPTINFGESLEYLTGATTDENYEMYIYAMASGMGNCTSNDIFIDEWYTELDFTYRVERIGYAAFSGCSNITSVTIPDTIEVIEEYAFSRCVNLTSIYYNGTMDEWNAINKGYDWDYGTGYYTVYCTDGAIEKNN